VKEVQIDDNNAKKQNDIIKLGVADNTFAVSAIVVVVVVVVVFGNNVG
jgi:hypothetical protein